MSEYQLRGTPSTLIIDRQGHLRKQHFGNINDMVLGAELMALMREVDRMPMPDDTAQDQHEGKTECSDEVCPAPKSK